MKERTRQRLLRLLGYTRRKDYAAAEWVLVYVPEAIQAAYPPLRGERRDYRSAEAVAKLGAKNIHVHDGQLIADWPQKYWQYEPPFQPQGKAMSDLYDAETRSAK